VHSRAIYTAHGDVSQSTPAQLYEPLAVAGVVKLMGVAHSELDNMVCADGGGGGGGASMDRICHSAGMCPGAL